MSVSSRPLQLQFSPLRGALSVFALASCALGAPAIADQADDELITLLNAYRQTTQECSGETVASPGPLAPNEKLGEVQIGSGQRLLEALQAAGYRASRARAMAVGGPSDAESAMRLLQRQYCTELLSNRYAEVGVSRSGATWQIVLASPLLSGDLGDWEQAGRAVLEQVNAMRARTQNCGTEVYQPAPAVSWNATLAASSLAHSRDMADQGYFSHFSPDGDNVGDRASREGYRWRSIGENIAAGQGSAEQAVAGWMKSPGHCSTIMNADFTEMGAAYATNEASPSGIYWTQVFGRPR